MFATIRIGAVYVPLNFRLTPPELSHHWRLRAPGVLFDRAFEAVIKEIDASVLPPVLIDTALDGSERL